MKTTLHIKGMHCESCKALIEEVLPEIKGITKVTADFKKGTALVEHTSPLDKKKIQEQLKTIGEYTLS